MSPVQILFRYVDKDEWKQGILLDTEATGDGLYFLILRREDLRICYYWDGDIMVKYDDTVGDGIFRTGDQTHGRHKG